MQADDEYASVVWREARVDDRRQLLTLLAHLTHAPMMDDELFAQQFGAMQAAGVHILVAEDAGSRQLLATGALHVLPKLVRGCARVGLIEDVVVDPRARRRGLGKELVERLVQLAQQCNCYKAMLNCAEARVAWYESTGLRRKEVQMVRYL